MNDAKLLFDGNRGVHIPRDFALEISQFSVQNMPEDGWEILANGHDNELYWEVWDEVLNNVILTEPDTGIQYYLMQDQDVWMIPVDSVHQ